MIDSLPRHTTGRYLVPCIRYHTRYDTR